MAAEAEQSEAPRVQLALVGGCEEEVLPAKAKKARAKKACSLQSEHLKYLAERGIPAEAAAELYKADGSTLLIPYCGPDGQEYLISSEDKKADGQPFVVHRHFPTATPKFVGPTAAGNRPYFSRLMPAGALLRMDWPVVFVEGPIKVDALWCGIPEGFLFVGLSGTWNWRDRRGSDGVWRRKNDAADSLPELRVIPMAGRQIITLFDSDITDNNNVYRAAKLLRAWAQQRGGRPHEVVLPSEPNGNKNGADDFLVRHGTQALLDLLQHPEPTGWPLSAPMLTPEGELRNDYSPSEQKRLLKELGQIADITIRDSTIRQLASRLRWKFSEIVAAIEDTADGDSMDDNFFVSIEEFDDSGTLDSRWIVPSLLPRGEVIVLTADPGLGKSLLIYELLYAVATGSKFLGFPVQNGKVLILQLEEGKSSWTTRLKAKGFTALGAPGPGQPWALNTTFDLAKPRHVEILKAQINNVDVVMIDSARAVGRSFDIDENHADFGKRVIRPLARLFNRSDTSGVIIHHNAKGSGKAAGTADITAAVWGVFNLKPAPGAEKGAEGAPNEFHLISDKGRDTDAIKWHLRRERTAGADESENGWQYELIAELQYMAPDLTLRDKVYVVLKGAAGPLSLRQIAQELGLPDDPDGKVNSSLRSAAARDAGIRRWRMEEKGPRGETLYRLPEGFWGYGGEIPPDQGTERHSPAKEADCATRESSPSISGLHLIAKPAESNRGLRKQQKSDGCVCVPPVRALKKAPPAEPVTPPLADEAAPADQLVIAGSTESLVLDLETQAASNLWATPNGTGPFIRLVGTDHGNNTDPLALGGHKGPLIAHNGFGFDFLALAHHHQLPLLKLSEEGRLVDTMVVALALDPPEPPNNADGKFSGGQIAKLYSLDNCAARAGIQGKTDDLKKLARTAAKASGHTGKPSELEALGYGLIPQGNPDYNAYLRGDIAATRGVFDHLCPNGELTPYIRREMRIMGRLTAGITMAGTRLDVELCRQRFEEVEAQKATCRESLINRYGLPTATADGREASNPLSCKGAAEAITAAATDLALELPITKTGKPSTSKENLRPLLEQAMEAGNSEQATFLETILGLTGARSVYGTALANLQQDGRIHPRVSPLQTSGRFSITDPGITVFGKRAGRVTERAIFLPDTDEHVLIACDLSQIDMRAIAAHAQDPAYLDLFAIDPDTGKGRDAHSEVAAAVGLTRDDAKAIGHGWNYGMSVNGMVAHGIDRDKAEQFDRGMRKAFPKLVAWRDRVRSIAENGHRLNNGFGRMMRPNPNRAWTQGPALMGQGTARDLMMETVLRLPLELVPQLRFLVHDELVFSVAADHWESARDQILEAMTFEWAPPGAAHTVTVTGDASRPGRSWAECYAK